VQPPLWRPPAGGRTWPQNPAHPLDPPQTAPPPALQGSLLISAGTGTASS